MCSLLTLLVAACSSGGSGAGGVVGGAGGGGAAAFGTANVLALRTACEASVDRRIECGLATSGKKGMCDVDADDLYFIPRDELQYIECMVDCEAQAECTALERATCGDGAGVVLQCIKDCVTSKGWPTCDDGEPYPPTYKCDDYNDCDNGIDEAGCPAPETFSCDADSSILATSRCDGYPDCENGADERGCGYPSFQCDGKNWANHWKCDGYADCSDESDEQGCAMFTCDDGETVPEDYQCDGYADCGDESDEKGCSTYSCP